MSVGELDNGNRTKNVKRQFENVDEENEGERTERRVPRERRDKGGKKLHAAKSCVKDT